MGLTHFHMTFHRAVFSFVKHQRTLFDVSGLAADIKLSMSGVICLKYWTESLSSIFNEILIAILSLVMDSAVFGEEWLGLLW